MWNINREILIDINRQLIWWHGDCWQVVRNLSPWAPFSLWDIRRKLKWTISDELLDANKNRIVIITSIVVAATAAAVSDRFDSFSTVGGIIGTSVSAAFLILLGLMNAYILYKLYKQIQKVLNLPEGHEDEAWKIEGGGILFNVLRKMFKVINRYDCSDTRQAGEVSPMANSSRPGRGRCTLWEFYLDWALTHLLRLPFLESRPLKPREEPTFGSFWSSPSFSLVIFPSSGK